MTSPEKLRALVKARIDAGIPADHPVQEVFLRAADTIEELAAERDEAVARLRHIAAYARTLPARLDREGEG